MPTVYLEATNGLRLPLLFVEDLEPSDVELLAATIGALAGEAPAVAVTVADQETAPGWMDYETIDLAVFESPELQAVHEVVEWAVADAGLPINEHEEFIQKAYGALVVPGRGVLFTTLTVVAGDLVGQFQLALPDDMAELTLLGFDDDTVEVEDIVDADAAAEQIRSGRRARVSKPDAVLVIEALADDVEPSDLTLMTINGLGLFAKVARNALAREDMPQIPVDQLDAFRWFLAERGVSTVDGTIDPVELSATQNQLDGRKTGKFLRSIRTGAMNGIPLWVSADRRLLDGHHRWAAEAILSAGETPSEVDVVAVGLPISRLLDLARTFNEAEGIESKAHGMTAATEEFRFRRDQPRAPAGSVAGGQWINDGATDHLHGTPRHAASPSAGPVRGPLIHPEAVKARDLAEDRRWRSRQRASSLIGPSSEDIHAGPSGPLFGKGARSNISDAADLLFGENGQLTTVPFRSASRRKGEQLYNRDAVTDALSQNALLRRVDPRSLHATQPMLTRPGVEYYLGQEYKRTGRPYADVDQSGNQVPVIYKHPRSGQYLILSGHHRAAAALLRGRPLEGIVIEDDRTPLVAAAATVDSMYRDVTELLAIDEDSAHTVPVDAAVLMIKSFGMPVVVGSALDAEAVLVQLGADIEWANRRVRWAAGSGSLDGVVVAD